MTNQVQTINPTTEEIIKTYDVMSWSEIDQILESVHQHYLQWSKLPYADRQKFLHAFGEAIKNQREVLAKMITQEMGKPIAQSRAEIDKCIGYTHYTADHINEFLNPRVVQSEHIKSYVDYQPQGIVFAIMPWNFPLWQVIRFIVPTLLSGNAAILSHAPISTGCSLMIETLVKSVGIPVFRSVINTHEDAAKIIADPRVIGVTLTGSEQTGKIIGAQAGQSLKRCVLELGGSDPYVILEDANLEQAAAICVQSRMANAGQVCVAAKRLIVVKEVYEKFVELVAQNLEMYQMDDPTKETTILGPLARRDIRDNVHKQVQTTIAKGATCVTGGAIPDRKGFYYPPTLLTNIPADSFAYNEEIFGPVVAVLAANDEKDAIKIANSVRFGLGASVFTANLERGERIARDELIAGTAVVNSLVASDNRFPFGGAKSSGVGREMSLEGVKEFLNAKTITVDKPK